MFRCVKLAIATSVMTLTGCSYLYGDHGIIHDRDREYLQATSTPPLRIPPGMSSSTIEAHYPVSDKVFSTRDKKVDLTPPELEKPFIMPDLRPVHGSQPNIASETPSANRTFPAQRVPNNYYDPFTRSTTSKAGMPIGEVFSKILPGSTLTSNSTKTTTTNAKSSGFSFSSLWPWGKKSTEAAPAPAQTDVTAENNTSQTSQEKSTMHAMYYDPYSGHR